MITAVVAVGVASATVTVWGWIARLSWFSCIDCGACPWCTCRCSECGKERGVVASAAGIVAG